MPAPRASILPSPHTNARNAGVNSPSPFMEGGGRQAGGEVKADRQTKCEINLTGTDKSTTTSPNTDSRVSLLFRNRIDSSVNRACPPKTHSSLAP